MAEAEVPRSLLAFLDFQERNATHTKRRAANLAELLGRFNDGMNILFEHRSELARLDILGDLSDIFRHQSELVQSLVEVESDEAESFTKYVADLKAAHERVKHA